MKDNGAKAFIDAVAAARKDGGISQRELGRLSGIRQPVIARMESGAQMPTVETVMKLLAPLGKTLAVVSADPSDAAQAPCLFGEGCAPEK